MLKAASSSVANKESHSDLVIILSQAYFLAFLCRRHWRVMALSDRRRGGRQWRLTELNGLTSPEAVAGTFARCYSTTNRSTKKLYATEYKSTK